MSKKHSYTNPEDKFDAAYVEAQVTEGKKYYDEQGWEIAAPISDRECIYKCLDNSRQLAGLDRKQVARLCEDFKIERSKETLQSEYPPL